MTEYRMRWGDNCRAEYPMDLVPAANRSRRPGGVSSGMNTRRGRGTQGCVG